MIAVLCLATVCQSLVATQTGQDQGVIFAIGELSARDEPRVHRIDLRAAAAWDLVLEITNPSAVDLDLFAYREQPRAGESGEPLCASEGAGKIETCRVTNVAGQVWVRVVPVGGDSRSRYVLRGRPVGGPVLEGTLLAGSDARQLELGRPAAGVLTRGGPDTSDRSAVVYSIDAGPSRASDRLLVAAWSADQGVAMDLTAFDATGNRVAASEDAGAYQELLLDRVPGFVVVRLAPMRALRRSASYSVVVFDADKPIPIQDTKGQFAASGTRSRSYTFELAEHEGAIAVLEGMGDLAVATEDSAIIPVTRTFGTFRQTAVVGERLSRSPYVVAPVRVHRAVRVTVRARDDTLSPEGLTDTLGYKSHASRGWGLRIRILRGKPSYLVRFNPDSSYLWLDWAPGRTYRGVMPDRGVATLRLPAPPEVLLPRGKADVYQQPTPRAPLTDGPQFLARLVGPASESVDLAICTSDGEALDVSRSTVGWQWPLETAELYLVVFPDPWHTAQGSGAFEISVTRSTLGPSKF